MTASERSTENLCDFTDRDLSTDAPLRCRLGAEHYGPHKLAPFIDERNFPRCRVCDGSLFHGDHSVCQDAAQWIDELRSEVAALNAELDAICPPGEIVVVDRRNGTNRLHKLVETFVDWDHNYIDGSTNEIVPYAAAGLRQPLYRLEPQ